MSDQDVRLINPMCKHVQYWLCLRVACWPLLGCGAHCPVHLRAVGSDQEHVCVCHRPVLAHASALCEGHQGVRNRM